MEAFIKQFGYWKDFFKKYPTSTNFSPFMDEEANATTAAIDSIINYDDNLDLETLNIEYNSITEVDDYEKFINLINEFYKKKFETTVLWEPDYSNYNLRFEDLVRYYIKIREPTVYAPYNEFVTAKLEYYIRPGANITRQLLNQLAKERNYEINPSLSKAAYQNQFMQLQSEQLAKEYKDIQNKVYQKWQMEKQQQVEKSKSKTKKSEQPKEEVTFTEGQEGAESQAEKPIFDESLLAPEPLTESTSGRTFVPAFSTQTNMSIASEQTENPVVTETETEIATESQTQNETANESFATVPSTTPVTSRLGGNNITGESMEMIRISRDEYIALKEEVKKLKAENSAYYEDYSYAQATIENLQLQIEKKNEEIADLKAAIIQKDLVIQKAEEENAKLVQIASKQKEDIFNLEFSRDELIAKYNILLTKYNKLKEEYTKVKEGYIKRTAQLKRLSTESSDISEEINALVENQQKEITELTQKYEEREKALISLTTSNIEKDQQITKNTFEIQQRETIINDKETVIAQLEYELEQRNIKILNLQDELQQQNLNLADIMSKVGSREPRRTIPESKETESGSEQPQTPVPKAGPNANKMGKRTPLTGAGIALPVSASPQGRGTAQGTGTTRREDSNPRPFAVFRPDTKDSREAGTQNRFARYMSRDLESKNQRNDIDLDPLGFNIRSRDDFETTMQNLGIEYVDLTSDTDFLRRILYAHFNGQMDAKKSLIKAATRAGAWPLKYEPKYGDTTTQKLKNIALLPTQTQGRVINSDLGTVIIPGQSNYTMRREGLNYVVYSGGKKQTFASAQDAQYFVSSGGFGRKTYGSVTERIFGMPTKNLSKAVY